MLGNMHTHYTIRNANIQQALERIHRYSPYLSGLLMRYPDVLPACCEQGFHEAVRTLLLDANQQVDALEPTGVDLTRTQIMDIWRHTKGRVALAIALADLSASWGVRAVTKALSTLAEAAVRSCLQHLLQQAVKAGTLADEQGFFVLGMGKLGAYELNYSSDIDLMIFYDARHIEYRGRHSLSHFASKMAGDLMSMLQERTSTGYVFRTDLRLRPDPSSTPLAISVDTAMRYYETVGQNWERAAMIKARFIAGSEDVAQAFLQGLRPFIWRKYLDFAAIGDILSIKRQMQAGQQADITIAGHHLKTGRGGIREIEFLVQLNQLIWGGRIPSVRSPQTLVGLKALSEQGIIPQEQYIPLMRAYLGYRKLEHRLQMMRDEQTHIIPEDDVQRAALAGLSRLTLPVLEERLHQQLLQVHGWFNAAFTTPEPLQTLALEDGRLVFTGVEADSETMKTLSRMGFAQPEAVCMAVAGWHKGNKRATKTSRSRELLTELVPAILQSLGRSMAPDMAFARFDAFLGALPSGVQIFSLFHANPNLLDLVAEIMGTSDYLASTLAQKPHLLYAVLTGDFFGSLPDKPALQAEIAAIIAHTHDDEEALQQLQVFRHEKQFQAGVQLLHGMVDAQQVGAFLADIADIVLHHVYVMVSQRFVAQYGSIPNSHIGIVALGRLGSREMTFTSDIDMMVIYDVEDDQLVSTGAKPLTANVYVARLAQRLVGALSAATRMGQLYEVDTRLRPFGNDSALAVNLHGFVQYYTHSAWVYELLALTRARVICGDESFAARFYPHLHACLRHPRTQDTWREGVLYIRSKIAEAFFTVNPWDLKHCAGGLLDIDFMLQYWLLVHYAALEVQLPLDIPQIMALLRANEQVPTSQLDIVIQARTMQQQLQYILRLCGKDTWDEANEPRPELMQNILVQASGCKDYAALEQQLHAMQMQVSAMLDTI